VDAGSRKENASSKDGGSVLRTDPALIRGPAHAIDQPKRIGRQTIAAPVDVIVGRDNTKALPSTTAALFFGIEPLSGTPLKRCGASTAWRSPAILLICCEPQ
jgi:hypothetical protein